MRLILPFLAISLFAQTSEFIADAPPTRSAHASTVIELKPGVVMAAWFGGTDEGNPDVAIWGARKVNGKWEAPKELVREPKTPTWNPVLFRTADGVLWLYYKFGTSPQTWTAGKMFSKDDGQTWSKPEHLPAGLYGPIRAKPLVLKDGTIVSGTSVESYLSWASWIERSTDNGKTWTRHGPILSPPASTESSERIHGTIQPVVVEMPGGSLRIFARSTTTIGRISVADSKDGGLTWTAARTIDLPNPNAGIDVVRLKDGRYVMIYNHTPRGRSPLNLAVSPDGEKWTMFHALESEPGEYSYPAMVQGIDGSLHITYTWKRQKIKYVNWPLANVK